VSAHFKWRLKWLRAPALVLAMLWPARSGVGAAERANAAPAPVPIFADTLWDDGRAEVSVYTGVTSRYNQPRPLEQRMIVVKEDLLRDSLVKSDAGPVAGRTVTAIKLNTIADFTTGTYAYHQMTSVFVERANARVLKLTMSHTEGCGITFVRIGPRSASDPTLVHESHSYWDGESDREVELRWPAGERVYADALPLWLRRYAGATAPFSMDVQLLPTQVNGRAPLAATRPVAATIAFAGTATIDVPAGRFASARFTVTVGGATDTYWLGRAAPHVLLRMDTAAGRHIELKRTLRLDYWNHRANGDERMLD
jgi:hypothetical protein